MPPTPPANVTPEGWDSNAGFVSSLAPTPPDTANPIDGLLIAGVTAAPTPPDALPFAETQRFYNAGFAAGARAALDFAEASVLALPNEDRDGYEERWVKRSGVTGIIEIGRREYIAPTPPDDTDDGWQERGNPGDDVPDALGEAAEAVVESLRRHASLRAALTATEEADRMTLTYPLAALREPEGTIRRKVWFSETLALGLGASLVDWGEPDKDGFYSPSLTRTLAPTPPDALREAAQALVRRTDGLTVHFTGGMPYLVVKPDWFAALRAALTATEEADRE